MGVKERVLKQLKPLIADAKSLGKWFRSKDGNVILSPKELEEALGNDEYLWGQEHWNLKYPEDILKDLRAQRDRLNEKIEDLERRMKES